VLLFAGCRGTEPPYPPGKAPEIADLMAAAAPSLRAIQVPRAKVRQGGGPAANLMLVAQAPARFSGTIQIAGNELVTLAVNEDEYGLRWVGGRDGAGSLTPGFYSGPPSRCAVETLLGVDLEPEGLPLRGPGCYHSRFLLVSLQAPRANKSDMLNMILSPQATNIKT
jgi:hypothetical protein